VGRRGRGRRVVQVQGRQAAPARGAAEQERLRTRSARTLLTGSKTAAAKSAAAGRRCSSRSSCGGQGRGAGGGRDRGRRGECSRRQVQAAHLLEARALLPRRSGAERARAAAPRGRVPMGLPPPLPRLCGSSTSMVTRDLAPALRPWRRRRPVPRRPGRTAARSCRAGGRGGRVALTAAPATGLGSRKPPEPPGICAY
jgi:hypothetical protein